LDIFNNKICVITGAASGIGRAISELLLQRGAQVFATDISETNLNDLKSCTPSSKLQTTVLDVTKGEEVKQFLQEILDTAGRIDYLFNVAGITVIGEAHVVPIEEWRKVLDVDLHGTLNTTVETYRHMVAQGSGHIVNLSSIQGLVPLPPEAAYVTAKYAVVGLSQTLRIEGKEYGVKVSVVNPGLIKTPMLNTAPLIGMSRERHAEYFKPWERFAATPASCAKTILRGVERNKAFIPVTFMATLMWWINRISPSLLNSILTSDLAKLRAAMNQ